MRSESGYLHVAVVVLNNIWRSCAICNCLCRFYNKLMIVYIYVVSYASLIKCSLISYFSIGHVLAFDP